MKNLANFTQRQLANELKKIVCDLEEIQNIVSHNENLDEAWSKLVNAACRISEAILIMQKMKTSDGITKNH